jgi:tRNA threonylcarbamoyladenosine biosynthesis protein TsaE
MLLLLARSTEDTARIAASIARLVRPRDMIVLAGEMGAGKTTFTQAFALQLGVTEAVTSPTFNLIHTYTGTEHTVHHVDLYRLERTGELDDLGLDELQDAGGVMIVEWGDVVGEALGDGLVVTLAHGDGEMMRTIGVARRGRQWESRWSQLESALRDWTTS